MKKIVSILLALCTIDFTNVNHTKLFENITFDNITLTFTTKKYMFASGYALTINENVTVNGTPIIFGGSLGKNCDSTNLKILGGEYQEVCGASHASSANITNDVNVYIGGTASVETLMGGGYNSNVGGNTYVTVGGSALVKTMFGAGNGSGIISKNTYVTVCDNATVKQIFGGGIAGTIKGSTYVTLKDNANPDHTVSTSDHSTTYAVYGGGRNNIIEGSTNITVMDNAKSNYIYGGSDGTSTIGKGSHVNMLGGAAYSVYGGSPSSDHGSGATVTMTGGTVHQLFGGNEHSSLTGDVTIKLLGGTVMRRVFGGCYNDWSFSWDSSYNVAGTITLIIGSGANLALNSESDNALSAHSRRSSVAGNETGIVLYTNSTAKSNNSLSTGIVAGGSAANETHCHTYTPNGSGITQSCTCGNSATATVTANNAVYTGEEAKVKVEYSPNWEYDKFDVKYSNNINVGTATATLNVYNNDIHSVNYTILKATQKAPVVKASNNTIMGLTTNMEYSTDGLSYTAVTDTAMTFGNGTYYIRYGALGNNTAASPATKVFFGSGISANNVSALNGKTVDVIINIPANSGISSLDLSISYDTTALTLDNVAIGNVVNATYADGKLTWSGNTTTKTGTLAKLTFTVSESAATGSYAIELSQDDINTVNGTINVVETIIGDVSIGEAESDGKISTADILALRSAVVNENQADLNGGADVNGDGVVNSQDVVLLCQYIASYNYDTGEAGVVLGGAE